MPGDRTDEGASEGRIVGADVEMVGTIPTLLPESDRPTVGVVASETGQWIWEARSLGFVVEWVWAPTKKLEKLTWLKEELSSSVITDRLDRLTNVDLILCEARVPMWLADWRLSNLLVSVGVGPQFAFTWGRFFIVNHQEVGGLLTTKVRVKVFSRKEWNWNKPRLEGRLQTSVYQVASDTVDFGSVTTPPETRLLTGPAREVKIGKNTYHAGGLYPLNDGSKSEPNFKLPSVFSRTRWVRRRLTTVEKWNVKDVPVRIGEQASREIQKCDLNRIWNLLKPGRCLYYGLKGIVEGIGCLDDEGRLSRWKLRGDDHNRHELSRPGKLKRDRIDALAPKLNDLSVQNKRVKRGVHYEIGGGPDDWSSEEEVDTKATKRDDAKVDVKKWNVELCRTLAVANTPDIGEAADVMRRGLVKKVKRKATHQFFDWMRSKHPVYRRWTERSIEYDWKMRMGRRTVGFKVYLWTTDGRDVYQEWWKERYAPNGLINPYKDDVDAARDALWRLAWSTWWEWADGSRCLHWRWPQWYQETIRDGYKVRFASAPPRWTQAQRPGATESEHNRMKEKLQRVRNQRYVGPGPVDSLTSFFAVPKGEDDVRMVYDGTKSGLNDAIWVPSFPLPTVDTMLRAVTFNTAMSDFDLGDCFLNFVLHVTMQALCGIDLSKFCGSDGDVLWERWVRAAMGLKSSPYQAVQAVLVAREVALGDRLDENNAFRWKLVKLNLPGSREYDPSIPWVAKFRSDGTLAADLFMYVDDGRVTAPNKLECKLATRQAASRLNFLGIQEAARKRRWGSRKPGAWAGSVVTTDSESVNVLVSQEKWDKTRKYIGEIMKELDGSTTGKVEHKPLERKRGFLIYVTRTYPCMVPYLKGIHLTLDSWRDGRDDDGWKRVGYRGEAVFTTKGAPALVDAVPRLQDDLFALSLLTQGEEPPLRRVRSKKVFSIYYGFGDASAVGFCSTFQKFMLGEGGAYIKDDVIHYRYGHWCCENGEASSNYRELLNLVEGLEAMIARGELTGAEIWLFTDNSTAESVFYKGNSTSKTLFNLVLRLRRVQMEGDLRLHVIHVAGKRMIVQGTDGGSRGDLNQGVMAGENMLGFVPLHLSAMDRSGSVERWIRGLWDKDLGELELLTPEGWFSTGHGNGSYLWVPPPAAADVVAEQIGEARHKRPGALHIVVVPRLMTGHWRRMLLRQTDFSTVVPLGSSCWPDTMFEPLMIFVCFPHIAYSPWRLKGTTFLVSVDGELRTLPAYREKRRRHLLRQLFFRTRRLQTVPEGLVRGLLHNPPK